MELNYNIYLVDYPMHDSEHPLENTNIRAVVISKYRKIRNLLEKKLREDVSESITLGRGKIKDTGIKANKEEVLSYVTDSYC